MIEPAVHRAPAERVSRKAVKALIRPRVQLWSLPAVTLLAALVRFHQLGAWSLWGDEVFTLQFANDGFNFSPLRQATSSTLISLATRYFGINEWSGRLVPALFGIVSIPILYLPIRRMLGPRVALLSSLLLAISTWHLYWSQNARFYTALLLFYSLALFAFYLALEKDRPSFMVAALVFLGLAAKERLLALFFVPVAAAYILLLLLLQFERPRGLNIRNLAILLVPGGIGAAVFAAPYVLHLEDWFINFGHVNNSPAWILAGVTYYTGVPVVSLGLIGAVQQVLRRNRAALLLGLAASIPVVSIMALAPIHYTANRYAFVSLTSWIVLASLAIVTLFERAQGRRLLVASVALALAVGVPLVDNYLYFRYQNGNREDARAAFQYVAERMSAQDIVVAANTGLAEYYLGTPVYPLKVFDFSAMPASVGRAWIIEDMTVEETAPQQYAWLKAHATEVASFDVRIYARNFKMRVHLVELAAAWPAKP